MAAAMRVLLWTGVACGLTAAVPIHVHGSGTTNPSKFFWQIMETIQARAKADVRLTYRAVGSSTGQKEFSQVSDGDFSSSLSDFGSGDIPMSASLYAGITTGTGRVMVHVPFCLGAIGIFHSVPADEIGGAGLKLSPCLLAKIFDGVITTWDHADIKADNPGMQVPAGQKIKVGHRMEGSSSTGGVTGYLEAKCSGSWTRGSGSSISWPSTSDFVGAQGSDGMKDFIVGTPYAIGYLDAGHGHGRNLQEVMLQNEADTWLTSLMALNAVDANGNNGVAAAGAAAVASGAIPANPRADWSNVNLYMKAGTNTWPIVLVSYMYLNEDMSSVDGEKVGLIKAFLDMVTGAEGQDLLASYSFNKLPAAMNSWSSTWNTYITKPATWTSYSLLTATDAWTGMGPDIITVKRTSYSLWKLGELDLAMTSLTAKVAALESSLDDYGIVPLHGSGTTNPKNWFAKAMKLMESRSRVPLHLTYRAVGSSTGQEEFVGNAGSSFMSYNHFGAGDLPMTASRFSALQALSPPQTMVHLPFALGAIGIFHSIPSSAMGGADLKMDACLLAKIFSGAITTWDHADVLAQNSGLSVPAGTKIHVGHRTLGSSSTGGLSGYLTAACSGDWTLGSSSTISWPVTEQFHALQGSPGMQAFINDNAYAIGYLDAGHGHDFGFAEVALTNAAGKSRTSLESIALGGVAAAGTQAVQNGVFPEDSAADWSAVNLYNMAGDTTWPIVLVSYIYAKRDQTASNPKSAAALKAFIDVILNDRDGLCAEFGFTLPSDSVKTKSLAAAASITYPPGMVSFTFETDTDNYEGMAASVISGKRFSYDDYERSVLKDDIATLRSAPRPVAAPVIQHESEPKSPVPLVLSLVALLLSCVAGGLGCMAVRAAKGGGDARGLQGSVIGSPGGGAGYGNAEL